MEVDNLLDLDAEMAAMTRMREVLAPLDSSGQRRVLLWASDAFGVSLAQSEQRLPSHPLVQGAEALPASFAELLELTEPASTADRAMVAMFWLLESVGGDAVDGRSVNRLLKEHGIDLTNVTNAISKLIDRKPRFAIQAGKKGKFEKLYRLTSEGRKAVVQMMRRANDE